VRRNVRPGVHCGRRGQGPADVGVHRRRTRRRRPPDLFRGVLFTDAWDGDPPTRWAEALRLLATLAEQSPGYLGYDVEIMDGGREYAVTHWASPAYIRQWKKSSAIVIGDNGLLSRIYGREGCLWPWLDAAKQA
jgi:hypothetical protein